MAQTLSLNAQKQISHSPITSNQKVYTETLPLIEINGRLELSESLINTARECNGDLEQLSESRLIEIISNLEREREAYLEAVTVLQDQLRESHEQCHQLSQSHAEIISELEAEIDTGWKEAQRYKHKYDQINKVIKSCRIKNSVNQYLMGALGNDEGATDIFSTRSVESCPITECQNTEFLQSYMTSRRNGVWVYTLAGENDDFQDNHVNCPSPDIGDENENTNQQLYIQQQNKQQLPFQQDNGPQGLQGQRDVSRAQDALDLDYDWKSSNIEYRGWIYLDTPIASGYSDYYFYDGQLFGSCMCSATYKCAHRTAPSLFDLLETVDL